MNTNYISLKDLKESSYGKIKRTYLNPILNSRHFQTTLITIQKTEL
ncbi:hypothetical protein [Thalassobellus sediminis]